MSTMHVTPSAELRNEVDRVLERMSFVQELEDLMDRGQHPQVLRLLEEYSQSRLVQDPELGIRYAWCLYHTHAWERRRLLAFAEQLRPACYQHPLNEYLHRCRNLEAVLRYHLGDLAAAEQIWREEIIACVADGYEFGEMIAWSNLGMLTDVRGRSDEAIAFFQRALSLDARVGRPFAILNTYNNIAMSYLLAGRLQQAEHAVMLGLQKLAESGGGEAWRPWFLLTLGQVLTAKNDQRAARAVATRIDQMSLSRLGRAELARLLGIISFGEGSLTEADEHLSFALQEASDLGERLLEAEVLEARGEVQVAWGDPHQARERYLAAEAIYLELPSEWRAAQARARADALTK